MMTVNTSGHNCHYYCVS